MPTPEELARVNIDKQLEAAGWIVQDFIVLNLGEGQGLVVQEFRTYHNQHIVEEELKKHGVRIEYVLGEYSDTPEGNFMKNIRATVAEYERLKITERLEISPGPGG